MVAFDQVGDKALRREIAWQAAAILVIAVATRIAKVGDPTSLFDEQFYLLVGDRIWQGALPFVDIWDRKPIGLFLIYALLRPLSSDGVVAYQVAALLFAAATTVVLVRIARRVAGPIAALAAGGLYLVYLPIIGGGSGQSPIFYDLFTVIPALLVVRCLDGTDRDRFWRNGIAAMLLTGLAMQVKYTALFEGIAFGLMLLWLYWKRYKEIASLALYAAGLIVVALLPTALAFCFYALDGHAWAFVTANFLSIFQKKEAVGFSKTTFISSAFKMAPILLLAVIALVGAIARRANSPILMFAVLWGALAFVEFFVLGHYFDHYAIPLLMPLFVVLSAGFEWMPFGVSASAVVIWFASLFPADFSRVYTVQDQTRIAALTEVLAPYARKGCIYINDGPPILYLETHSCLPTPYVFPGHLVDLEEAGATNATVAMAALLQKRPSAIVIADRARATPRNPETDALLQRAIAADYHLVATLPDISTRHQLVYARNDLH